MLKPLTLKGINSKRKKWRQKDFESHISCTKPEWVEQDQFINSYLLLFFSLEYDNIAKMFVLVHWVVCVWGWSDIASSPTALQNNGPMGHSSFVIPLGSIANFVHSFNSQPIPWGLPRAARLPNVDNIVRGGN